MLDASVLRCSLSPQCHGESRLISGERRNLAAHSAEAPGGATSYLYWEGGARLIALDKPLTRTRRRRRPFPLQERLLSLSDTVLVETVTHWPLKAKTAHS